MRKILVLIIVLSAMIIAICTQGKDFIIELKEFTD